MEIYSANTIEYRNIDTDELYEERDIVFWFDVPKEWAEKWCKNNGYNSLEEFDGEYIWSNSWDMYCSAIEDNVVIDTKEISNEIVYSCYKQIK